MAKHRSHKRRSSSKSKTMRRAQRGGDLAGNPASSWGWVNGTVGNGWTQFMNSLTLQPGQNLGTVQSNNIVPVNNINAQDSQPSISTNLQGGIPNSVGGRRRRRKSNSKRSKKGGNLLAVANQAIVPGFLLAAQQTFGKSRKHKK
jgi:hypothetical protein